MVDYDLVASIAATRENGTGDLCHVCSVTSLCFVVDLVSEVPSAIRANDKPLPRDPPFVPSYLSCSFSSSVVNPLFISVVQSMAQRADSGCGFSRSCHPLTGGCCLPRDQRPHPLR